MRVTLYLLRKDTSLTKEILRKHQLYTERSLRDLDDESAEWQFFVRQGFDYQPRWFEHVNLILAPTDSEPVYAKSAGAVLLVRVDDRVFAVTFGLGFHSIGAEITEPDFGLRVTANCVGKNGLTMADARGLGKGKRNAFSRLPSPGEMFSLGLLTDEEWIRKFGGEVEITGFAKSAAGADALQLNIEDFRLVDLPAKLRQALKLYESDSYQLYFPFLDYFRRVSDKELIGELDGLLVESMRARDP
ncbi:hypothetical protein DMH04_17935 [Kibdelosporangium aridum]|uniref:Uncharacterized protein n=1 Tax=Kibdelosporangium aridum TaxID=2030 RepID=A0A428ZAX6_KIBAR|nr:DUF6119 family protein [Kibdelosporangium aridum]RSM85181.1 hypothetical protein DMH04_17935 [Kibdelosporangium aridum]